MNERKVRRIYCAGRAFLAAEPPAAGAAKDICITPDGKLYRYYRAGAGAVVRRAFPSCSGMAARLLDGAPWWCEQTFVQTATEEDLEPREPDAGPVVDGPTRCICCGSDEILQQGQRVECAECGEVYLQG